MRTRLKHQRRRPVQFPLTSTALFATCSVLAFVISHVNSRYCAFGFGGFQCNEPFIGRGGWLLLATLILLVAVPLSLANWVWRLARWRKGARSGDRGSCIEPRWPAS